MSSDSSGFGFVNEVHTDFHLTVSGEEEIKRLRAEIKATEADMENLNAECSSLRTYNEQLQDELSNYKFDFGIDKLEDDLRRFQRTSEEATRDYERFLQSVGLGAAYNDGIYGNAPDLTHWAQQVREGSMTATEAIARTKADYAYLLEEISNSGGVDSSVLQGFVATLDRIEAKIQEVAQQITEMQVNGVKAFSGGDVVAGSTGAVDSATQNFTELAQAIKEVAAESESGNAPVTNLVDAVARLGSLESNNMAGVVQMFKNIGAVGQGSYSEKSINNIINLLERLRGISDSGLLSIAVNFSGLNDLKVRKTSLNNLAEYLPRLAEVNASKLSKLSTIDLTNFNNIKVSKSSVENITRLAEAVQELNKIKAATIASTDTDITIGVPDEAVARTKTNVESLRSTYSALTQSLKLLHTNTNFSGTEEYQNLRQLYTQIGNAAFAADDNIEKFNAEIKNGGFESAASALEQLRTAMAQFNYTVQEASGIYPKAASAIKEYYNLRANALKTGGDIRLTETGWASENNEWDELVTALNKAKTTYDEYMSKVKSGILSEEEKARILAVEQQEMQKLNIALESLMNKEQQRDNASQYERASAAIKKYYDLLNTVTRSGADVTKIDGVYTSNSGVWSELAGQLTEAYNAFNLYTSGAEMAKMSTEQGTLIAKQAAEAESRYRLTVEQSENAENARRASLESVYAVLTRASDTLGKNADFSATEQFASLNELYKNIGTAASEAGGSIESFEEKLKNGGFESAASALEQLRTAMAQFNLYVAQINNAPIGTKKIVQGTSEYNAALKQTTDLLQTIQVNIANWTKAAHGRTEEDYRKYAEQAGSLQALISRLKEGKVTNEEFANSMRQIIFNCESASSSIIAAGEGAKSSALSFKTLVKNISQYFSVITVMSRAVQVIREMVTTTIELDTAMTELKKVTDNTAETYNNFLDNAMARAKKLGATVSDVVTATADFARLGYSIGEATSLADAAIVYKNVGDGISDISEASESIISTMQAYGDEVSSDDAMLVVDKFNAIGNAYAISSQGVGEALQRSAAAMASANNTLDETIALVTAANTVVQNPETVGTSLKTVSMYLRAAKTEADAAGESTDGMAGSVSELRRELLQLTGYKVDIQLDENNFKSTYEILKELSRVWDDLSDISQANILEIIGGKRNSNVIAAILNNFEVAENALETSAEAAGSAVAENEKYLDSVQGKISKFKATFEELSSSVAQSNVVGFFVDVGTVLLECVAGLSRLHVIFPSIIASLAIIKGYQTWRDVAASAQKVQQLTMMLISEKAVTDTVSGAVLKLNAAEKAELKTKLAAAVSAGSLTAEQAAEITTKLGLVGATKTLTTANRSLAASIKGVVASVPVAGWIATGISVAIEAVTALSGWLSTTGTSLDEINDTVQTTVSEFTELKSSSDDIIPRFAELSKGVNNLGENVSLTDEEYEEFWELNNKLAELFPELDAGLDSNGNHILTLSYSIDSLTDSLKALVEAERQTANESVAENMSDALKTAKKSEKGTQKEIDTLQNKLDIYNKLKSGLDSGELIYPEAIEMAATELFNAFADNKDLWGTLVKKYTDGLTGEINWTALINSEELKNEVGIVTRQLDALKAKQSSVWAKLNPIMGAWLQTTDSYTNASDNVQTLLSKIVGNIDYKSLGITNAKKLKSYIQDTFITPITNAEPEVQNAMLALFNYKSMFDSGEISVGEYKVVDNILQDLKAAGISDEILLPIKTILDYDDYKAKIDKIKSSFAIQVNTVPSPEVDDYINGLSNTELEIAYNIIQANGSMTLDQLKEKIKQARYAAAGSVTPLNFTDFVTGLDEAASGLDKITSAMKNLASGTALTKQEMMELVTKYPQLLEQANLFTDGTVESQENALNSVLDLEEQAYDAKIDAKIAELEATVAVLDEQLALETQKANVITELENMVVNGKVTQEEAFTDKVAELNNLQGQNYVSVKDGELQVNEEALNDHLSQETDYGKKSTENIWEPIGQVISNSHTQGLTGALTAVGNYMTQLYYKAKNFFSSLGTAVSNALKDALSGNWQGIGAYFKQINTGGGTVSAGKVSINFTGQKTTIDGKDVDSWIDEQKKASTERIAAINELRTKTVNSINNLKALKGLKLSDLYGKTSGSKDSGSKDSSSKDKSSKDEKSPFELMYDYHKHLVEIEQETTADFLDWLDDAYKAAYKKGEIDLEDYYKYEEEVYDGLKEIRENAKDSINDLIEYKADMLKQDIENEKDALDKKMDNLSEFYDKQKELLESQRDEEDYLKDQAEKRKSVTDIQDELRQLERDNSAWAQKRKAELRDELAAAKDELDEFERDHALDETLDYLDKTQKAQEEKIQAQIDALDKKLNDPGMLFNQALSAIKENTGNLFQQMLEYNRKYGTGNDDDVKETYEEAYKAAEAYKDVFASDYEGIKLANSTGYKKPGTGTVSSKGSSNNSTAGAGTSTTTSATGNTTSNKSTSSAPSLVYGASIKVKKTATHFGSKSKNVPMMSFVPGGSYTVYGTSGDQVLIGQNGEYTGWIKKTDIEGYAKGTSSATRGLHAFDEEGTETIFESSDGNRYKMFTGGEKVLNARASSFLYNFANDGGKILERLVDVCQNGVTTAAISPNITQSEIVMGDIIIQGNADSQTVSQIRREQRSAVETILKEFNKLSK